MDNLDFAAYAIAGLAALLLVLIVVNSKRPFLLLAGALVFSLLLNVIFKASAQEVYRVGNAYSDIATVGAVPVYIQQTAYASSTVVYAGSPTPIPAAYTSGPLTILPDHRPRDPFANFTPSGTQPIVVLGSGGRGGVLNISTTQSGNLPLIIR